MDGFAAECSTSNALAGISKQLRQDEQHLHRDSFSTPSTQYHRTAQSAFRRAGAGSAEFASHVPAEQQMVDEFLRGAQREQASGSMHSDALFQFPLANQHRFAHPTSSFGAGWAGEFASTGPQQFHTAKIQELTDAGTAEFENAFAPHAPLQGEWQAEFLVDSRMAGRSTAPSTAINSEDHAAFEAAFSRHASDVQSASWTDEFADDTRQTLSNWATQFDGIQTSLDTDAVADQFEQLWRQENGDTVKEGQDIDAEAFLSDPANWNDDFMSGQLTSGNYTFEQANPFHDHSDPVSEADRLAQTSLQQTALALEAAVQRDAHRNDAALWLRLGQIQAENEKEIPAIRALERAVELDPDMLPAYLTLAISYINEGYDLQAYRSLEQWIRRQHPDLPIPDAAVMSVDVRRQVLDAYLIAARQGQASDQHDPDVQIGLGVLLYGGGEFDKAVDCFVAALESRLDDYLLWNRLGATLANSGKSEDAIAAYHRALDIKPSFVRARYNLGVSCINVGCHREAAEHLLGALAMHGDREQSANISSSLWDTLRRVLYMMERRELAEQAVAGADLNQFRGEFEF